MKPKEAVIFTEDFLQNCIISLRNYIEDVENKNDRIELSKDTYTQKYLRCIYNLLYLRSDMGCKCRWDEDHKTIISISIFSLGSGQKVFGDILENSIDAAIQKHRNNRDEKVD